MPKKTFSVDDFSGGANTFESPQNVAPNEVVISKGFHIAPGKVTLIGDMKGTYVGDAGGASAANDGSYGAASTIIIEPGYGLFTFSHDYQADGGLGETKYMVLMDGTTFDIWADSDTPAWAEAAVNLGTGSSANSFSGVVKPCFFLSDGALRISPGNFSSKASGAEMNASSGALASDTTYGGIQTATLDSTSNIVIGDTIVIENTEFTVIAGSGTTWYFARNMTGNYPNSTTDNASVSIILDTRWYGVVNRNNFPQAGTTGKFTEWFATYSSPRPPITWSDNVDDSAATTFPFTAQLIDGSTDATIDGTNAPCLMVGYENAPAADNDASTWNDSSIKLYCTALYDESRQESTPHLLNSTAFTVAGNKDFLLWIGVAYKLNTGGYLLNKRVTGARIYYEDITNDPGILFQMLEIDFEKGCKKVTDEKFTVWDPYGADDEVATCPHQDGSAHANRDDSDSAEVFIFSSPPKFITYEINTGYPPDTTIHARYKTATVLNRRLFVGNIYQDGVANGDRMIGSPVNQFDILPSSNTIDVTVGDGDQIVKLEGFADRILQFKKRSLYIINVGAGQGGEYLESQHKNMGVQNPSQTCLTEYGVAWVNSKGVFLYDGKEVVDLTRNKLQLSNSTAGKGLNITESNIPSIGYHPDNKWLIVQLQTNITGSGEDQAWVLDFKSGSWMFAPNFTLDSDYKTNMEWTADDKLIFAGGTKGSTSDGANQPQIFTYQSSTNCDDSNYGAQDTLEFLTKEFDLELPGVKKTLKSVHVSYAASAHSYLEADIIYKDSSGESTVALEEEKGGETYYTEALGFKSTSGAVRTVRLVPTSSVKKAYTFQFKLHNDDEPYPEGANFQLYSISFAYRLLGAK